MVHSMDARYMITRATTHAASSSICKQHGSKICDCQSTSGCHKKQCEPLKQRICLSSFTTCTKANALKQSGRSTRSSLPHQFHQKSKAIESYGLMVTPTFLKPETKSSIVGVLPSFAIAEYTSF